MNIPAMSHANTVAKSAKNLYVKAAAKQVAKKPNLRPNDLLAKLAKNENPNAKVKKTVSVLL
jgi:hypothetical protein